MGDICSSPSTGRPMKKAGKVTLGYWNLRGACRGNPARYMLNYAKVTYEEKTYVMGEDEWKNSKDSLGMEFPNLPYIKVGDFIVSETLAVHQYIAEKFCPAMLGKGPAERALRYRLQLIANENFVSSLMTCFGQEDKAVST